MLSYYSVFISMFDEFLEQIFTTDFKDSRNKIPLAFAYKYRICFFVKVST